MKIVMAYQQETGFGGMKNVVKNLSNAMRELGHKVEVFEKGKFGIMLMPILSRKLINEVDVFNLHGTHTGLFSKGHVLTVHTLVKREIEFDKNNLLYRMGLPAERRTLRNAKKIITVSEDISMNLKKYYGIDNSVVIHNGIDLYKKPIFRRDSKCVLMVGRLVPRKNFEFAFELAKEFPELHFYLCGDGMLREKLIKIKPNNVSVLGYVSDERLCSLYLSCDFQLITSLYEGDPINVLESMNYGCPLVAPKIPSITGRLKDGRNSVLFESGDFHSAKLAVSKMMDSVDFRERLARSAHKDLKEFTWDKVAKRYLEVFKNG